MDERSPLINQSSNLINDAAIPKFITDPNIKLNQHFKYAVPSQETEEAHKDRFRSIKICYLGMFLSSVSFTISISSMWPFLLIIDKSISTSFFGWIVSSYSIGQLISSPLFGFWANKIKCHKIPILACMVIMIIGNLVYLYIETLSETNLFSPKVFMLISRFIMGVGAACAAVTRSYVSSATNLEERTPVLANISACQGIGFIIGPVLQAALVPIGYPGLVHISEFRFNMYTSPAFISILIYLALFVLMLSYFNEYVVLDNETQDFTKIVSSNSYDDNKPSYVESLSKLPPPDYTAVGLTLLLFFMNCLVFSFYETLSSPLTIDMYAWSKSEATLYNGIILGVLGLFAVAIVLVSKILAKRIKEKILMLIGYIVLWLSILSLLPWGDQFPSVQIPTIEPGHRNTTTALTTTSNYTTTEPIVTDPAPRGCPLDYDWCYYTPIIKFYQFIIGFTLLVSGYSVTNVMSFAIYSKLLGPKPQGTMMGLLTSCGSLSRAVGPIIVSYLYGIYGPRVSFATLGCVVFVSILIIAFTFKRYEPYRFS